MTYPNDELWAKVTPRDVQRLLAGVSFRWWIAGGWALDPDGTRSHRDIDVAVLRTEHEALREELGDWDLRVAYKDTLRPWRSGPVKEPENAMWARPTQDAHWHIDFKIELVEGEEWIFRRDPTVRRPLSKIGHVYDGIPFLAADLARVYKRNDGVDTSGMPSASNLSR